jgi:hypothetical protein
MRVVACLLGLGMLFWTGCKVTSSATTSEDELIGNWRSQADGLVLDLVLRDDGTYSLRHEGSGILLEQTGTWDLWRDELERRPKDCFDRGKSITCPDLRREPVEVLRDRLYLGDSTRVEYQRL